MFPDALIASVIRFPDISQMQQERKLLTGKPFGLWVWLALIMFCCWVWNDDPLIFLFPPNDSNGTELPISVSCYLYKTDFSADCHVLCSASEHQTEQTSIPVYMHRVQDQHLCVILVQLYSQDIINLYSTQGACILTKPC